MELSSILEADIQGIQKQLKTAILNHQIGMMKLKNDPENVEAKKQISDAQSAIISLSTSQKFILQKLRNDVLANGLTKSCFGSDSHKRPNPMTVNGTTAPTIVGISNAHSHIGHHHSQHMQAVRHKGPTVSVGTETVGLAAMGRENQPPKANGNFPSAVAPNVAGDASPLGGKLAHEGPPYLHRPHPTPPPPSVPNRQCSRSPVECSPQRTDPRSRVNMTSRSSLSPYSSGGEDLDADEDEDEEEEEVQRPNDYDAEEDLDELRYSSEDEKKDVLPKKDGLSPCKHDIQMHPSDDHDVDSKLKFFAALGLVTRETCSEMQSRRGERKRRSTANPQFVYGNWDLSVKRKKNGYLLTSTSPLQLRKRGRPRLDGTSELALLPTSYLPLPKSLSNIPYSGSKDANSLSGIDHFNENHHQFGLGHQMLGHALGGPLKPSQHYYAPDTLGSGHHPKKPLEHINGNISTIRKFCVVCKNISGPLVLCEECDVRYHPFCGKPIDGKRHCPKCEAHSSASAGSTVGSRVSKDDTGAANAACKEAAITSTSPSSTVTCSAQVTTSSSALHSLAAERAAKVEEKRRLLLRNQELNAEKAKLEQRVSELSADLSAQAVRKRDLLSAEEKTRRSIKKVHDFIRNIQQGFKRSDDEEMVYMPPAPMTPCSVATSASEGVQTS